MVGRSGLSCLCRVAAYIACLVPTSLSIGEGTFGSGGWGDDGSRKRVSRFLRRLGQEDAFFQDCGANVGELDFCGVDGVSGFPDPDSNLAPPTGASRSSHGGTHRRTSRWVRVTASGQGRARRRLLNPERHTSLDRWVQLALAGVAVSVTTRARGSDRSLARSRLPRFIRGEKSRRRTLNAFLVRPAVDLGFAGELCRAVRLPGELPEEQTPARTSAVRSGRISTEDSPARWAVPRSARGTARSFRVPARHGAEVSRDVTVAKVVETSRCGARNTNVERLRGRRFRSFLRRIIETSDASIGVAERAPAGCRPRPRVV